MHSCMEIPRCIAKRVTVNGVNSNLFPGYSSVVSKIKRDIVQKVFSIIETLEQV